VTKQSTEAYMAYKHLSLEERYYIEVSLKG